MTKKHLSKLPGLTLIELVISMVIILPFLTVIIWLTGEISNNQLQAVNYDTSAREAQFASLVIAKDLDDATQITVPAGTATGSQMTLVAPGGTIVYTSTGGRLVRMDAVSSEYLLSSRSVLKAFDVTRSGENLELVTVDLVVEAAAGISGGQPAQITRTISRQIK